jgi:PEP-CTERM motif
VNAYKSTTFALMLNAAAGMASAAVTAPCSGIGNYTNAAGASVTGSVVAIRSTTQTYCSTAFGWSDTWFASPTITAYNQNLDVYSGENALNLQYKLGGVAQQSNLGFVTPIMDRGTTVPGLLEASGTRFLWNVVEDVNVTASNQSRSIIRHSRDLLELMVLTTVVGNVVTKDFSLTNFSTNNYTDLFLGAYFNFHPNGSNGTQQTQGTTSYTAADGLLTTGNTSRADFRSNGGFKGFRAADYFTVGSADGASAVWQRMQLGAAGYDNAAGPFGPTDSAGALAWVLGNLNAGQTVTFTTYESLVSATPPASVPEPGSFALAGLGAVMLGLGKFRRRG